MTRTALIAGGGIAGLATALALVHKGWSVRVLEQADQMGEVGAGLQISPNGMKVLDRLGVTTLIENSLFEPEAIEVRLGQSGRRLMQLPMRDYAKERWGGRYIHIHRADLANALADALQQMATDAIICGKHVTGYQQSGASVRVTTQDGTNYEADMLVGADGIHSNIRRLMLGADTPRFTGNVAWRALIPVDRFGDKPPPPTACIWAGDKRHAVTTRVRAGALVNFVGMVERSVEQAEDWAKTGDRQMALDDFAGWAAPVVTAIEQAESLNIWPLYDRPPLPRWSDGRVVLVGDAAHPMLPSLAQGAVQSLEDAVALAGCLERCDDVAAAGQHFYEQRFSRASRVQRESAANVRRFHRSGAITGPAFYAGMAIAGKVAPNWLQTRNDWLFGTDPTAIFGASQ